MTAKATVPEQQPDLSGKLILRAKEKWARAKRNLTTQP
jgi:hypothetical protein